MLKDKDSSAIVAVTRYRARHAASMSTRSASNRSTTTTHMLVLRTGATQLVVYVSDFAGTNKANAVVWGVGDEIEAIVGASSARASASSTIPTWAWTMPAASTAAAT